MLALFMVAAQAVALPSAPVLPRTSAYPAPPIMAVNRTVDPTPVTFDVEVRAGNEMLWSGPMRVSGRTAASFSRQKTDASATACADPLSSERSSLNLSLNRTPYGENVTYSLRVTWDRPASVGNCGDGRGTRSVSLTESFDSDAARDVTVNGDGGLVIRLRRR